MCEPISLTTGLLMASTALSATGAVIGGLQAQQQGKYASRVATANARAADDQARDAIDRGKIEAQQHWRRVAETKGAQQAALAAGNVDTSFGSARSLAEDTAMIGNEDADALYRNTFNEVRGFDSNAVNYRSQAQASRMEGNGKLVGSLFGAGSTILGGATQYAKLKAARNAYGIAGADGIY